MFLIIIFPLLILLSCQEGKVKLPAIRPEIEKIDKGCWEELKYGLLNDELMRLQGDAIRYTDLYIREKNWGIKNKYSDTITLIHAKYDEVFYLMYGSNTKVK